MKIDIKLTIILESFMKISKENFSKKRGNNMRNSLERSICVIASHLSRSNVSQNGSDRSYISTIKNKQTHSSTISTFLSTFTFLPIEVFYTEAERSTWTTI